MTKLHTKNEKATSDALVAASALYDAAWDIDLRAVPKNVRPIVESLRSTADSALEVAKTTYEFIPGE